MKERISIKKNEVLMAKRSSRGPLREVPTFVVTLELSIRITMPDGESIGYEI